MEGGVIRDGVDLAEPLGSQKTIGPGNVLRLKFGWITTAQLYPVIQNQGTTTVYLQTPAIATRGIGPNSPPIGVTIMVRDLAGNLTGEVYILERRLQYGLWDQFGTDVQAFVKGVTIRKVATNLANSQVGSVLVNTDSLSSCCKTVSLIPGPVFTSPISGVIFKTYSATRMWQRVEVTLGSNYPVAPANPDFGEVRREW